MPLSNKDSELLIELLRQADTPTDVVAEALKADRCDFTLRFGSKRVFVKGNELQQPDRS